MAFDTGRAREVAGGFMIVLLAGFSIPEGGRAQTVVPPSAQPAAQPVVGTPTRPNGTKLSMGGLKLSGDQPVEVTSDELQVDQNANTATFAGNVLVVQGDMRMTSKTVLVEYGMAEGATRPNQIYRLTASGGVLMTSPTESAEGQQAVYTIADKQMVMTGDVVVTQGPNVVTGQRMVVNLADGTAVMVGRVRTIIDTSKPAEAPAGAPATAPAAKGGVQ